jgi:hypothetical protein
LSLAPGESRNIALVNWRRRQLTALEERTTTSERLTATFVQNRAIEEITSAVAREHQAGKTQTEANTAVTAGSFVAAGAVVGGGAGAIIGTLVEPGVGTLVGAGVGAAAGVVAGGLVYSGSQALGMIEADTEGDREIVADVQQRISLSTSQTASAVRSFWSTVVVEDAQAKNIEATTSNVTNYNHMHALNIEYYEVLQHYLVRIDVERVQPILFLPFTFFDFRKFRFVRDYWDAVRMHIDDKQLKQQGDAYFIQEDISSAPDLLPIPPEPSPPGEAALQTIEGLEIDLIFKAGDGLVGAVLNFVSDVDLKVVKGSTIILPNPEDGTALQGLDPDEKGKRFKFGKISDAQLVTKVRLDRSQAIITDVKYLIRVHKGELKQGNILKATLDGFDIVTNAKIRAKDNNLTIDNSWTPAASALAQTQAAFDEYNRKVTERNELIAENQQRQAAYESLVRDIKRFEHKLQDLILRRRHFFTRVILNAIEPEEITQLLETLKIGHEDIGNPNFGIPLSAIAHTIPLGMTTGGFVLKLKRHDKDGLWRLAERIVMAEELVTLLQYSDQTLSFFEDAKRKEAMAQTDHVYVPTGGLFAEAILGRANSAEYLDMERYFNWQDSPIPHQAPAIQPVGTESRFQQGDVNVNVPEGNLQVINPINLPDPTGLQGVLAAIQNPNLFRDMSKASELAGIIGSLSALAGQMGQAASTMTGQAAQQAMQAATEASKAAAGMAQSLMSEGFAQTNQGAALNKARELDQADTGTGDGSSTGTTPVGRAGAPAGGGPRSSTSEDIVRKAAGLSPVFASTSGVPFSSTQRTALLVFQENSGNLGSTVFGPLLDSLDASTKKKIEDSVDYWVEEFENTFSGFANSAGHEYNSVEFLEDATAIPSKFKERVKALADQGFTIDVITIGHGSKKRLVGFQGASITDVTLSELKIEYGRALPIRMVYMMNCLGSTMNSAWINAGATVSGGSRGDNFMPEPMLHTFWKNWLGGMNFANAMADAYRSTKGIWNFIYKDLNLIPAGIQTATQAINDSEPIFEGDGAVNIGTNIKLVPDTIIV